MCEYQEDVIGWHASLSPVTHVILWYTRERRMRSVSRLRLRARPRLPALSRSSGARRLLTTQAESSETDQLSASELIPVIASHVRQLVSQAEPHAKYACLVDAENTPHSNVQARGHHE